MASNAHFYQQWRLTGASTQQQDVGCNDRALTVPHFFRTPLIALLVAVSYYAGTKIGFILTPTQMPTATFWPPNAILFAAFLLTPRRMWWALLLAVLPVHLLVQLRAGIPVATVLGWFVGNAGEALLGAICIRYFEKDERSLFTSVRGVSVFLGFGVLVAPILTSFLDAAGVMQGGLGSDYWSVWTARLFSNMLANITVAPTIVLFGLDGGSWIREARPARYLEAGLLGLGIVLASILIFGGEEGWRGNTPALLYGLLPFLLWASVRFGLGGLNASLLVIALISTWNLVHGRDPFISGPLEQNALALKAYLVTIAVPLMFLSVLILEMQRTSRKLIEAQEQERYRIGRELHDDIGQQLVLIGLEVEGLMSEPSPKRLDRLYSWVSGVAKATRDLSHDLHPAGLSYVGLTKALRSLCRQTGEATSITINFAAENVPPLAGDISLSLYRVAQEALQNIVKHSHAQTADVELSVKSGLALLRIADDGAGITLEKRDIGSIGLTSMHERLAALDGTLKIVSTPMMKGTIIEASVPLKSPRRSDTARRTNRFSGKSVRST